MNEPHDGFSVEEGDVAILDDDLLEKTFRDIKLWRDGKVYYVFDDSMVILK